MSAATYTLAQSVDHALRQARALKGNTRFLAGGTDLLIQHRQRLATQPHLIDLSRIPELRSIAREGDEIVIGSQVTLAQLLDNPLVAELCPLLQTAARTVATPVIRQTATVGGNLLVQNRCTFYNQSLFWRQSLGSCLRDTGSICQVVGTDKRCYSRNVSDLAPAAIALDGRVTIRTLDEQKVVPLIKLYSGDGIHIHRHLDGESILTHLRIPVHSWRTWYRKLRLRRSVDFTSLTIAAAWDDEQARIAINGVSMAPVLLTGRWGELRLEELQRQARKRCQTVDNDHLPLPYRREMLERYLAEWWEDRNRTRSEKRDV
jgi:4-hydroxybenzoyl-CoA reductase subunit beta